MGTLAPERQQIGDAAHAVHEPGRELAAEADQAPPGASPSRAARRGATTPPTASPQHGGERAAPREKAPEEHGEEPRDPDRREARPEDPHVEALERPDVLEHAAEQIAPTLAEEPRRRERNEGPEERHAQAGQQPQRDVVGRRAAPGSGGLARETPNARTPTIAT